MTAEVRFVEMTEEEFDRTYHPVKNHLDDNASWGGKMFETYGAEQDFVYAADPQHVWTWVEGDESDCLVSGRSFVNRLGYLITEEAYPEHTDIVVSLE
jgi:hypothetical protein